MGEDKARDKVTKTRRGNEGMEWGREPGILNQGGMTLTRFPRVPSHATADGAGLHI